MRKQDHRRGLLARTRSGLALCANKVDDGALQTSALKVLYEMGDLPVKTSLIKAPKS